MGHPNSKYRQPPAPPPPQCRRDGSLIVGVTDPHLNIVMANKEEGKSEMIGGKCNRAHVNTIGSRPYYFRRCKKQKRLITNIDCLSDDLVFEILVNLPALDIYKGAMLVRRNWYRIVHTRAFVYAHLQRSPKGLVLVTFNSYCTSVAIRQGRIEIYRFPQVFLSRVWSSFNGLLLLEDTFKKHLYITNPVTRQEFSLPHPPARSGVTFRPTLGYSPSTMEYKVVLWHEVDTDLIKCAILTAGVDNSWRDVCTQHISKSFFLRPAQLTQGFMHWCSNTHVWTLNLETEIMTRTPFPPDVSNSSYSLHLKYPHYIGVKSKYYLSTMGKSLSMLVWLSPLCWDIWDMASETGEWTKLGHINLEAEGRRLKRIRGCGKELLPGPMVLKPAGWLEYKEVLVLLFASYLTRLRITYNVRTQEVDSFKLGTENADQLVHLHTNSVEWLAPCR